MCFVRYAVCGHGHQQLEFVAALQLLPELVARDQWFMVGSLSY